MGASQECFICQGSFSVVPGPFPTTSTAAVSLRVSGYLAALLAASIKMPLFSMFNKPSNRAETPVCVWMLLKLETQSVSCNESWIFGTSSNTSKVSSQRKGLVTSNSLVWYFSTGLIGFLTKGHGRNGWCCVSFTWKIPYLTYTVINCCFIFTHKSCCHFERFILRSLNISHELTWTQENIGPWLTGFFHRFLRRQDTANLLPDFAKSARPVRASPGKVVGAAPNVGHQSCARCWSLRNTLPVSIHYEKVKKTTIIL